jgi:hypothetical protein
MILVFIQKVTDKIILGLDVLLAHDASMDLLHRVVSPHSSPHTRVAAGVTDLVWESHNGTAKVPEA